MITLKKEYELPPLLQAALMTGRSEMIALFLDSLEKEPMPVEPTRDILSNVCELLGELLDDRVRLLGLLRKAHDQAKSVEGVGASMARAIEEADVV